MNLFDGSDERSRIFQFEEILLPDYVPDDIMHREKELQVVADSIKPLLKRKNPDNLFIYGPSGCGKTTCVKYVIRQLLEHSSAVLPVYVNCWENSTQMSIYNRIIEEMRLPLPRRGLAADEIFDKIEQYVKNYKKPILLILDEMDGLRHDKLLYVVSRANEKKLMCGITGISNNKDLLGRLDSRVKSSLRFSDLEFREYSEDQLLSILRIRAERALVPGCYDERILLKVVNSVDDSSARVAIERLWKSAKHAEKAGRQKIMLQDVVDAQPAPKPEYNLSSEELLILDILKGGELQSSDLYDRFMAGIPKTKRQIRNYLELLENKGLIVSEDLPAEGMLKPRIFRLKA
ncbi:AAA family ATPase [Candidatus Micrarchaeota archaeon]|nr:AAA family ATPase [Candidatus Micrarchaeota archaeon]